MQAKDVDASALRQMLEDVLKASAQSAELIRALDVMADPENASQRSIVLRDLVHDAWGLARKLVPRAVTAKVHVPDEIGKVPLPGSSLVVLNEWLIALGCVLAEGEIQIKVDPVDSSEALLPFPLDPSTCWLRIRILFVPRDSACRIRDELLDVLGLANGWRQVHVPGSQQTVESEVPIGWAPPGPDVEVHLYVPHSSGVSRNENGRGSGESILLVEPEAMVSRYLQFILERQGYGVEVFEQIGNAMEHLRGGEASFDLAILGHGPHSSVDTERIRELRACAPNLPCILMTAPNEMRMKSSLDRVVCVSKPLTGRDLFREIERALAPASEEPNER